MDICSAVMANQGNLVPVGIQWVVSQLFYFFQLSLPVVFVFYILSMVDRLEKKANRRLSGDADFLWNIIGYMVFELLDRLLFLFY